MSIKILDVAISSWDLYRHFRNSLEIQLHFLRRYEFHIQRELFLDNFFFDNISDDKRTGNKISVEKFAPVANALQTFIVQMTNAPMTIAPMANVQTTLLL